MLARARRAADAADPAALAGPRCCRSEVAVSLDLSTARSRSSPAPAAASAGPPPTPSPARGARVVVTDIDGDRAATVAAELGERRRLGARLRRDAASTDLEAARDLALERFGRVDLVMNNVGVLAVGRGRGHPARGVAARRRRQPARHRAQQPRVPARAARPGVGPRREHRVHGRAAALRLRPPARTRRPSTPSSGCPRRSPLYLRPRGIGVSCLCPAGVATNIVEQITFYGEPAPPRGPDFPIVDADAVGELVADGVDRRPVPDPHRARGRRRAARARCRPRRLPRPADRRRSAKHDRSEGRDCGSGSSGWAARAAPMARRIVDAGYPLTLWARRPGVGRAVRRHRRGRGGDARGARRAPATSSGSAWSTMPTSRRSCSRDDGVLAGHGARGHHRHPLDRSTPTPAGAWPTWPAGAGVAVVDAPVSGGGGAAAERRSW